MTTNSGQEHAGEGVARYNLFETPFGESFMDVDPSGGYVDYTDHRAALEKLTRERDEARGEVTELSDAWAKERENVVKSDARIAALEAENAALREALEPFEELACEGNEDQPDETKVVVHAGRSICYWLTLKDLRRARATPRRAAMSAARDVIAQAVAVERFADCGPGKWWFVHHPDGFLIEVGAQARAHQIAQELTAGREALRKEGGDR